MLTNFLELEVLITSTFYRFLDLTLRLSYFAFRIYTALQSQQEV